MIVAIESICEGAASLAGAPLLVGRFAGITIGTTLTTLPIAFENKFCKKYLGERAITRFAVATTLALGAIVATKCLFAASIWSVALGLSYVTLAKVLVITFITLEVVHSKEHLVLPLSDLQNAIFGKNILSPCFPLLPEKEVDLGTKVKQLGRWVLTMTTLTAATTAVVAPAVGVLGGAFLGASFGLVTRSLVYLKLKPKDRVNHPFAKVAIFALTFLSLAVASKIIIASAGFHLTSMQAIKSLGYSLHILALLNPYKLNSLVDRFKEVHFL